jgi:hypothetical protein
LWYQVAAQAMPQQVQGGVDMCRPFLYFLDKQQFMSKY